MTVRILTGKKMLLIEDEEQVSAMYKKFFENNGATVVVAGDGKKGLEILEEDIIDVVVLDRMLSVDMDGFEVLRRMRVNEKTKGVPVVILSNLNLKDSEIDFIEQNAVAGYYVKADVSLDALASIFDALLSK
jgi:DNA-binding response OmpR family regulator